SHVFTQQSVVIDKTLRKTIRFAINQNEIRIKRRSVHKNHRSKKIPLSKIFRMTHFNTDSYSDSLITQYREQYGMSTQCYIYTFSLSMNGIVNLRVKGSVRIQMNPILNCIYVKSKFE